MDRRTFHRLCGGLIGGASLLHRDLAASTDDTAGAVGEETRAPQPRSRLVRDGETPLTLENILPGQAWVFHYPYRTTPCFLIGLEGSAPGGLGADASVIAFSAICTHKMSHPARPISHIGYRAEPVAFVDRNGARQQKAGTISCCSERSVYDPADGGRVLAGPAPMPLAAIRLELDPDEAIVATASLGPDRYDEFLDTFGFRLAMEHGQSDVRRRSGGTALATPAGDYSRQQIRC